MNYITGSLNFSVRYDEELENIIKANSTIITLEPKQKLSEPGDMLDYIYYIKEGRTRHIITNLDGDEKILYTLSSGCFFGEASNELDKHTGLYSATETKTILYKIPRHIYHNLIDENKKFRDAILYSYANKVLLLRYEIENLSFNSCKDRLKRLFCSAVDPSQLIDGQWYNLKICYTQYEIGTIVGGARVTISKLINELYNENFMRIVNRKRQVNKNEYDNYIKHNKFIMEFL